MGGGSHRCLDSTDLRGRTPNISSGDSAGKNMMKKRADPTGDDLSPLISRGRKGART